MDQSEIEKIKTDFLTNKENYDKIRHNINDECFTETEFERIFMDCVGKIRNKKLSKYSDTKLPYINSSII